MAIVQPWNVPPWRPAPASDLDAGEPVGKRGVKPRGHTATLVRCDEHSGRVVYGVELPLGVYASEVRELPKNVAERLGLPRMHAWLFTAVKPKDTAHSVDLQDYTVSFSALPYSQNRYFSAKLRRASHRSASEINRALVAALTSVADTADPEQRLQTALDTMSFVPFVHDQTWYSAWMVYPSRSDDLGAARFDSERNYTVGVCLDPKTCKGFLDIDPLVERDREDTTEGKVLFGYPSARLRPRGRRGPVQRPLSPEAFEKRNIAMNLAIELSLAGLVHDDLFDATPEVPRWVARQTVMIYREILYRWSQKTREAYPFLSAGTFDWIDR